MKRTQALHFKELFGQIKSASARHVNPFCMDFLPGRVCVDVKR